MSLRSSVSADFYAISVFTEYHNTNSKKFSMPETTYLRLLEEITGICELQHITKHSSQTPKTKEERYEQNTYF